VFIDLEQLDQYGNSGMITQDVTKQEKDGGVKGNILGNCKVFWTEGGQSPQAQSGFNQQRAPQQAQRPMNQAMAQNGIQANQQQAPNVNQQVPPIDFDDDIAF
jgi:hypothetical protein